MNAEGKIRRAITFEGGFHNSDSITVLVKIPNEELPLEGSMGSSLNGCYLSEGQQKKLNRHFCGISGCTCGGYLRAEITDIK